jgi:hypothetical protein
MGSKYIVYIRLQLGPEKIFTGYGITLNVGIRTSLHITND